MNFKNFYYPWHSEQPFVWVVPIKFPSLFPKQFRQFLNVRYLSETLIKDFQDKTNWDDSY